MSDESVGVAAASVVASPKTSAKKGRKAVGTKPKVAKKSGVVAAHPKIAVMVNTAISTLKERGGSSLQAIKKYIAANYKVDIQRTAPFIKKYLKTAVENGSLVQTKGKGATGSFRLAVGAKGDEIQKKPKAKKAATKLKMKVFPTKVKTIEKKAVKPKAKATPKPKPTPKAKTTPKPAPAKSPKKAKATPKKAKATPKKAAKTTKPKSPKAKKAKTPTRKAATKK